MSNFDNLLDDLRSVTDEVGKKAGNALEISRLSLERTKIQGRIRESYRRLGEIVYGGYKNGEDVSKAAFAVYEQLDRDFERVEDIYNTICALKAGVDVAMDEDFSGEGDEPEGEAVAELCAMEEEKAPEEAPEAPEAEEPSEAPEEPSEAPKRAARGNNENGIDVDAD